MNFSKLIEKIEATRDEIAALRHECALDHTTLGQIWMARKGTMDVFFAAIHQHPENTSTVFLCPIDQMPMTGTADMRADNEALSQASWGVRCGRGLWIKGELLPKLATNTGMRISIAGVQGARRKVAELARGEFRASQSQFEADADPEYEGWIEIVTAETESLRGIHNRLARWPR